MAAEKKSIYKEANEYFEKKENCNYKYQNYMVIHSSALNKGFIFFNPYDETELEDKSLDEKAKSSEFGETAKSYGLKFHVSIPEWDRNLYKKGFDLLIPILMDAKVDFKFLKSNLSMSTQTGQAGKDITIYANMTPEKSFEDWQELINTMTETLVKNGVPPGYEVKSTKIKPEFKIKGCNYVTYRYENESKPSSVCRKRPKPDIVKLMEVTVKNQEKPILYTKQDALKQNEQDSGTINSDERRLKL